MSTSTWRRWTEVIARTLTGSSPEWLCYQTRSARYRSARPTGAWRWVVTSRPSSGDEGSSRLNTSSGGAVPGGLAPIVHEMICAGRDPLAGTVMVEGAGIPA